MLERRRHERIAARVAVVLHASWADRPYTGEVIDLSASGLYIATRAPAPLGTRLRYAFDVRERGACEGFGAIVRVTTGARNPGFGVELSAPDDVLTGYVQALLAMPADRRTPELKRTLGTSMSFVALD